MVKILYFLLLITTTSLSAQTLTIVRGNGDYVPYEVVTNNQLTGFHIELIQAVAKKLAINIRFINLSRPEAFHQIALKKADAITYVTKSKQREEFIHYDNDNILSRGEYLFIGRKSSKLPEFQGDLSIFKACKVGIIKSYNYGRKFNSIQFDTYSAANNKELASWLLTSKKVDLVVVNKNNFMNTINNKKTFQKLKIFNIPIDKSPNYIGFSKKLSNLKIARLFGQEMVRFKKTNAYQKLLAKYKLTDF